MKQLPFLLILLLLTGIGFGCQDDDFSSDPSHTLSFSADTVKFDTIFTTIGSSTQQFLIYNRHNKPLNIESVYLAGAGKTGFYINVDGRNDTRFQQVEIRANDSLYVFVEIKVDPNSSTLPILIKDSVVFITNGKMQDVKLTAYGQNVKKMQGTVVTRDSVLTNELPFLIYDSLVISPEATLTIQAGTTLHFHHKAGLTVKGRLIAEGTKEQPITFRGDRTDKLFPNCPYDFLAGQWEGIRITGDSYENMLEYVSVRGNNYGLRMDSSDVSRQKITLSNSVIHNSAGHLISAVNCRVTAWNCQLSNAGGHLLDLLGGYYEFSHCTFANFYKWGIINSSMIGLSNYLTREDGGYDAYPLEKADFNNCIIYGAASDVSLTDNPEVDIPFNHLFHYCLLKSDGEDDENFVHTLWKSDPRFRNTGENYLFDYRLDSASVARFAGDPEIGRRFPQDINGNSRLTGEGPDLGAYQWMPGGQ